MLSKDLAKSTQISNNYGIREISYSEDLYNLKQLAEVSSNQPRYQHKIFDRLVQQRTRNGEILDNINGKKEKQCPECGKEYTSSPALAMHLRTHSRLCQCTHCGKRFSRPWLLQGHIRTHTGEKPFKCTMCLKAFADKSNLRAHIQTHSNRKPYSCLKCGRAFALKSYLYKHEEASCIKASQEMPVDFSNTNAA